MSDESSVKVDAPKRRGRTKGSIRPRLSAEEKGEVISIRVAGTERRAKLRRLGREWLEQAIDRAREPKP